MAHFNLDAKGREMWMRIQSGRADGLLASGEAARFASASPPLGMTLLHVAVRRGNEKIAARLLAAGANAEAATEDGDTPLMDAARHSDLRCLKLLLAAGASVSAANMQGHTALFAAVLRETLVFQGAQSRASRNATDAVRLLLRAGADPNVAGGSPLYFAAKRGLVQTTKLLLAAGADPNARYERAEQCPYGWALANWAPSVLDGAARSPWFAKELVALLLLRGARPRGAELHAAIMSYPGHKGVLRLLLAAGAPVEGENSVSYSHSQTLFSDEAGVVRREVVRLAVSPLDHALVTSRFPAVEELLAWGAKSAHPDARLILRNSPDEAAEALRLMDSRETSLRLAGAARRAAAGVSTPQALLAQKKLWAMAGLGAALKETAQASFDVIVEQMVFAAAQAAFANRLADDYFARGLAGLAQELRRAEPGASLALSAVRLANFAVLRDYAERRNAYADEMEGRAAEQLAKLPAARAYVASFAT